MRTFSLSNTHSYPDLDYHAFCQCACEYRGNFYDFIPQDGSGLSVSFGDLPLAGEIQSINVPGFASLVRGLSAGIRDDLASLACELNSVLHLLGPRNLCVPWFYSRIDPARRQLQYVNAGHEAPLLIRHGSIERLERTGAALGLSTRAVHRQKAARMEAGDLLAIFSEAVSEDAVLRVVEECPQAGTAELAQRVLEVSRGSGIGEDLTFAAVRVVGACRHPLLESRTELALCAA
jgi:sigma-B regulation protein RsbU (phosphoserine phosphatase)